MLPHAPHAGEPKDVSLTVDIPEPRQALLLLSDLQFLLRDTCFLRPSEPKDSSPKEEIKSDVLVNHCLAHKTCSKSEKGMMLVGVALIMVNRENQASQQTKTF